MAIIKCANCKSTISSNDKRCPHCDAKVEPKFCCPQCGSTELSFNVSNPADKMLSGASRGVMVGVAAPFVAASVLAASQSGSQIVYTCKKCGCQFKGREARK